MRPPVSRGCAAIDVGLLLDAGPWGAWQKAFTLLAALAVLFDGFDIQILGVAIPSIMREWHLTRAAFAPVAALGLAGMACGSPFAGYCGDRFGRRTALMGCVLIFGAATIATAFCHGIAQLCVLRAIAGAGVGGALPNAGALTAEFAPLRRRAMAVTLTIVCVPLGGMIAGLAAARILPLWGWHVLYLAGGGAPLLLALLLFFALPESPRYLARHAAKRGELIRTLTRIGHGIAQGSSFRADRAPGDTADAASVWDCFSPELRRDTTGLWLAFFACLVGIYLVFGWLPAMLTARGLNLATASSGLAAYNMGGVIGVLICSVTVTVLGSRKPLLFASAAGVLSALVLTFVPVSPAGGHLLLVTGIGIHGMFANAVQTTMYALAAHVYPTRVRSTGVACAAAVGRVGGIMSSSGGAAIIQAGGNTYLAVLAAAMCVTFLGLAMVRNHCPARPAVPRASG